MVNYERILKRLESEKADKKKERRFVPSQLDKTKKASIKYNLTEDIKGISKKEKEARGKKKEQQRRRKDLLKKIDKIARTKVQNKKVLKKQQATLTIKQKEVPSVLNDPNRFFKEEMEEAKKAMFFRWCSHMKWFILGGERNNG